MLFKKKEELSAFTPLNAETKAYREYTAGVDYLMRKNYYDNIFEAFRFYDGDQWKGLKCGGERPAALNVIKPIVDYKVATVAKNALCITYTATSGGQEEAESICAHLNGYAAECWENLDMDSALWKIVSDGCICGDSFAYYYFEGGEMKMDLVDATNVIFADENEKDIQKQPYILLLERRFAEEVRALAVSCGADEAVLEAITTDCEYKTLEAEEEDKGKTSLGKCLVILKLFKENGEVYFERSVKNSVVTPKTCIKGLTKYPLAHFVWGEQKNLIRGTGAVKSLVSNQIEINKALARLNMGVKQFAYPHVVYDEGVIDERNVENLAVVGSSIAVSANRMQKVDDVIGYLKPAAISDIALNSLNNMLTLTRELAGAGEGVTGAIDPEKTSGAAVIAVRDNAALPLNAYIVSLRHFIEETARIWFEMWCVYSEGELRFFEYYDIDSAEEVPDAGEDTVTVARVVSVEELKKLSPKVKVNISAANPFSRYAHETALEKLFVMGAITFEEYVEALPEDSASPKNALSAMIEKRKAAAGAVVEFPKGSL